MDKMIIKGGAPLKGTIRISGAKNAALPLICAGLLTEQPLVLKNTPRLADINSLCKLLREFGSTTNFINNTLTIHTGEITSTLAPYEIVRTMRASILTLGPMLARQHTAKISLPGGCAIGSRPVDLHIDGLKAMGADIIIKDGYIHANAAGGLKGAEYSFSKVSVTGTENILMAACLAKGTTVLKNTACEPEVSDLAKCLNAMGAKISGAGTSTITIEGVPKLSGTTHSVIADRIETGTYMIAAAITGGCLDIINTQTDFLESFTTALQKTGTTVENIPGGMRVTGTKSWKSVNIDTQPYPGYPTDLQAQFMALMTMATGKSTIQENIFENRMMHVAELMRMGAQIDVDQAIATVTGCTKLKGADVMATDLRASVSLILAGLAAEGQTTVHRIYHLDRGYEDIETKLAQCGANIVRAVSEPSVDSAQNNKAQIRVV